MLSLCHRVWNRVAFRNLQGFARLALGHKAQAVEVDDPDVSILSNCRPSQRERHESYAEYHHGGPHAFEGSAHEFDMRPDVWLDRLIVTPRLDAGHEGAQHSRSR